MLLVIMNAGHGTIFMSWPSFPKPNWTQKYKKSLSAIKKALISLKENASSAFCTHRTLTSTMLVKKKKNVKIHSVAC